MVLVDVHRRAYAAMGEAARLRQQAAELIARAEYVVSCVPTLQIQALRDEVAGLRKAMESRADIEQAKGIIMATMRCTADEAFDVLRQQSQHVNRKLRDVARDLIEDTATPYAGR